MAARTIQEPTAVMSYEVKTRVFEGPFDLLLQLITSHQLEITELSLVDIVAEYIAYLDVMRELDMEVTSEFLMIATTLIQLKARHLLPDDRAVDLDEELALTEERDRLLARLLACLTYKDVAAVFAHRLAAGDRYVPRAAGLDPGITPRVPEVRIELTPAEFAVVAERAFAGIDEEPDLDHLELDLPSVDAAIADLHARMEAQIEADFESLVAHCDRSLEIVAYFLALLELARWGVVQVSQESQEAPILVVRTADGDTAHGMDALLPQSEWSG